MVLRTITLLLILTFSITCPVSASTLSELGSVKMKVAPPKHFLYMGTTDAVTTSLLGGLFGLSGAVAGTSAAAGPDKEGNLLQSKLHKRGFYIEKAFQGDLRKELVNKGVFKQVTSSSSANGTLNVVMTRYGIKVAPTGFKRMKPLIHVQVSVKNSGGKEIYKDFAQANENDSFVKGMSYEEYSSNIADLERDLKILSRELAKEVVEEMSRKKNKKASSSSAGVSKTKKSKYGSK